jgi:hypothetical protein
MRIVPGVSPKLIHRAYNVGSHLNVHSHLPRPARWLAGVVAVAGLLTACSHHSARKVLSAPTTTSTTVAHVKAASSSPAVCPLTGLPAPGGKVPQRPVLAVKVDNLAPARPQYGLATADMVVEEPVEGGITRFIVIYQCHDASRIEPIRSGRLIDPEILDQLGPHPLLAYAGAIGAAVTAIDSSQLIDVGIYRAPVSAFWRDPNRVAPHNLESNTSTLYAVGFGEGAPHVAPAPLFHFGALDRTGTPAASVNIAYQYSDVTWTWVPTKGVYQRSYADTGPATEGEGPVVAATNIVIMRVIMYPSIYVEDATGSHENLLVLTGSGPAEVVRNGAVVTGSWRRPNLGDKTDLVDAHGNVIRLSPGKTWIELVPTTVGVTVTP